MPELKDEDRPEELPMPEALRERHRLALEASMLLLVCAVIVAAVVLGAIGLMSAWMGGFGPWY
jgi:hypothetical protein